MEALAEPRALRDAFWTLHRPPSEAAAGLALRLLHGLAATPVAAWAAAGQAGALYAMSTLLPMAPPDEANRVSCGASFKWQRGLAAHPTPRLWDTTCGTPVGHYLWDTCGTPSVGHHLWDTISACDALRVHFFLESLVRTAVLRPGTSACPHVPLIEDISC